MRYENAVEARARSGEAAERVVRHLMMPGHEVAHAAPLPGERIGEFLERTGWSKRVRFSDGKWCWTWQLPTVCMVNGAFVLQRQWKRRRIKATDQVVFLSRPLGGDSGTGKQVLGLVALIAASALALWVPGAIGLAGTVAGGLVTAGITVGASLLINALVAPKAGGQADAGTAQDTAPQAFSLSAAGNNPRPLQTIPVGYGRLRKYCDFATLPWSEFVGDEQYLNVLLCEGSGKYQHEQVLIDDTLLWDAGGVSTDFDAQVAFYDPGQTVTLFPVNVTTAVEVNGQQLPPGTGSNPVNDLPPPTPGPWVGSFIASAPGTLADALALDFAFPAGCFVVNRDGAYFPRPVRLEAEYRPVDEAGAPIGPWTQLFFAIPVYNTRKPVKFSQKVTVAPGRYEVRARRYGAEAADFDAKVNGASGSDSVVWLQLRSYLQGNSSFAKESTVAIRIRATQISQGSARRFSVISTRILPVWNGSAFIEQPTRNPLWAFLDAAINGDYGARRPIGKVDFNSIITMAAGADARGDTFDFEFRSPEQVPNAFDTILKTTRARHRWSGDLLSAVRDEARTIPQLLLTDREIVRGSLSVNWALNSEDQADAVLLEYLDQNIWGPAEVQYPPNSESFTATNPARIRLDGVISRVQAQQHAAFYYRQALYRRTTITLDTEWEGKMLSYGSFVRVQSELPQSWGSAGRIAGYDGGSGVLTLDPGPAWAPSAQHYVQIRTRRGRVFGPVKVSRFGSDELAVIDPIDLAAVEVAQGMTIADALARADDAEDPSFVLGTATAAAKDCIVLSGRPNGDRVTLTLAVDDPRVHDDDLADPPDIPQPPALRDRAAPIIILLQGNFRQGVAEPILDASWASAANAFYYEAHVSYDDGESWTAVYQGEQPSFAALVDYASLQLRVRGVGARKGAFNVIPVEPPNITVRPEVIEIDSFKQGLKDYVARELKEGFERLDKIAQFIASFAAEQDAHNWLQKNATHSLIELKAESVSASIAEVREVAVGVEAAFASYQITVDAKLDDVELKIGPEGGTGTIQASIETNADAIADVDFAVAELNSDVVAKIGLPGEGGAIQASVSTNSTAIATVNGKLAAQWTVTLDANGYVSGIKSYNDGSVAGTTFIGDIFQFAFPGQAGGSPVPVVQIANVNGSPKIVWRGDMYGDGAIIARMVSAAQIEAIHLAAQAVEAGKIAAGAINVGNLIADNVVVTGHLQANTASATYAAVPADMIVTDSGSGGGALGNELHEITSLVVAVVTGNSGLLIDAFCGVDSYSGGVSAPTTYTAAFWFLWMRFQVYVDGAFQREQRILPLYAGGSPANWYFGNSVHIPVLLQGLAPGVHTIQFRVFTTSSSGHSVNLRNIILRATEARR